MMDILRSHLAALDVQVFARPEWGSQNPRHRELLHSERDLLLKNSNTPLHTSIAHTQGMGVLVLSPHAVGVDVEVTDRVQSKVIARVASSEELQNAPTPASLWTAKEAAFKALRPFKQPSVLSDISIGLWNNIDSQSETFRLIDYSRHQAPSDGTGICVHISAFSFGFFVIRA